MPSEPAAAEPTAPGAAVEIDLPTDPEEKLQLAITVAREIEARPEQADQILARHRLEREELDLLMYEIAADPALAERYRQARAEPRPGEG